MENVPVKFKAGSAVKATQCEDKICTNCGAMFSLGATAKERTAEFAKLCSDCQAKACALFFGLFSDFKGE